MPSKPRVLRPGATYHVWIRGNRKETIFYDDEDRQWFLRRLEHIAEETRCTVFAYCLMTNHLHLVLRPSADDLPIVMQRLMTGFAQWINQRHELVGHIAQSPYDSSPLDGLAGLLQTIRYVHRNPVEAGLVEHCSDWEWSSDRDYRSLRPRPLVRAAVLEVRERLAAVNRDWATFLPRFFDAEDPSDFMEHLDATPAGKTRAPMAAAGPDNKPGSPPEDVLESLFDRVLADIGLRREDVWGHSRKSPLPQRRVEVARRLVVEHGFTQRQVARAMKHTEASVSRWLRGR